MIWMNYQRIFRTMEKEYSIQSQISKIGRKGIWCKKPTTARVFWGYSKLNRPLLSSHCFLLFSNFRSAFSLDNSNNNSSDKQFSVLHLFLSTQIPRNFSQKLPQFRAFRSMASRRRILLKVIILGDSGWAFYFPFFFLAFWFSFL